MPQRERWRAGGAGGKSASLGMKGMNHQELPHKGHMTCFVL